MTAYRRTSRKVALTAAFLSLAAGGTAACDIPSDDWESTGTDDSSYNNYSGPNPGSYNDYGGSNSGGSNSGSSNSGSSSSDDSGSSDSGGSGSDDSGSDVEDESTDEVFYCADEEGEIVDEEFCDDTWDSSYFLWYSPSYPRGMTPGTTLDGGDYFPANDRQSRLAFKLPATGKVANGTIKTNVVGRGSTTSGGSGLSSGG